MEEKREGAELGKASKFFLFPNVEAKKWVDQVSNPGTWTYRKDYFKIVPVRKAPDVQALLQQKRAANSQYWLNQADRDQSLIDYCVQARENKLPMADGKPRRCEEGTEQSSTADKSVHLGLAKAAKAGGPIQSRGPFPDHNGTATVTPEGGGLEIRWQIPGNGGGEGESLEIHLDAKGRLPGKAFFQPIVEIQGKQSKYVVDLRKLLYADLSLIPVPDRIQNLPGPDYMGIPGDKDLLGVGSKMGLELRRQSDGRELEVFF